MTTDMATKTLTSKQAAKLLGIKEATLYAYVSRGMLRSVEADDGDTRSRRYLAADVQALLKRKAHRRDPAKAAREALDWGAPVLESTLTRIEDGRLYYRGRDVVALAESGTFEAVAALLWGVESVPTAGQPPTDPEGAAGPLAAAVARATRHIEMSAERDPAMRLWQALRDRRLGGLEFRRQYAVSSGMPQSEFVCDEARLALRVGGAEDDAAVMLVGGQRFRLLNVDPRDLAADGRAAIGQIVSAAGSAIEANLSTAGGRTNAPPVPTLAALTAAVAHAGIADLHAYDLSPRGVAAVGWRILQVLTAELTGGRAGRAAVALEAAFGLPAGLFDAALILLTDHELNASSFAARVVASTGAHPYAVVSAAVAALSGPKHGGASLRVHALFEEAAALSSPQDAVAARLRRGEPLPGFGHQLYPDGDPRAAVLMRLLMRDLADDRRLQTCRALAEHGTAVTGQPPNIDFALTSLVWIRGLPAELAPALFALGRSAGWIAHAIEQYADDRLIRPRAKYIGI